MRLTTKRLILRQPTMKDVRDLIRGINNLNVSKYLLVVPYPYTIKDAKWWINHCREEVREKPRTSYNFNIEYKADRKLIGGVGLSKINQDRKTADIGYWLAEPYWRKGIMTEAESKLIDFAFDKLKLKKIRCPVFIENQASQSLAKSLGFKYQRTLKKKIKALSTGKMHREKVYVLKREDWRQR